MIISAIEWTDGKLKLIDQTKLPAKLAHIYCSDAGQVFEAIKKLRVRGAPAIGIAAAFGLYLGIKDSKADTFDIFIRELGGVCDYLCAARPTAVNPAWALKRMRSVILKNKDSKISTLKKLLLDEAQLLLEEDKKMCLGIAMHGAELIREHDNILTHCNAGALATGGCGTALGPIYRAHEQGRHIKVFVDETRPVLQGARLTAWELMHSGLDVTLICDNMAAFLMKQKKIDKLFVGGDRIAANGDTANKIGTYNLAVLANYHKIPFYVAAPSSSFDLSLASGDKIPIEERGREEIVKAFGRQIAPANVKVYNPAFDVTPGELITAIITEKGIFRQPYNESLKRIL